jgi:hypothetical protein
MAHNQAAGADRRGLGVVAIGDFDFLEESVAVHKRAVEWSGVGVVNADDPSRIVDFLGKGGLGIGDGKETDRAVGLAKISWGDPVHSLARAHDLALVVDARGIGRKTSVDRRTVQPAIILGGD